MRASRAPRIAIPAALCFMLLAGMMPAVAAGPSVPLPTSMAAVGDSITQAASSGGSLGANAPHNSWSTGTSTSVDSHYLRLLAIGAPIADREHNLSVSGAKMTHLPGQMLEAAKVQPDYLTVLIGGNDVCTPTEADMTDPDLFEADFQRALDTIRSASPATRIYVVSIPRVLGLWELFHRNWWARTVWSAGDICQSLLENPTSTNDADVQRRARVDARNQAFNEILHRLCTATTNCHSDGGVVYNTAFVASDVSGDYFHPSVDGQAKLASVTWTTGYAWQVPNRAPNASFTSSCSGLTCTFDDTSTDSDGSIVLRAWSFGGTSDPQSYTFADAGTYSVSLTVNDDDGASATATGSVTVSEAPPPTMRIADLSGSGTRLNSTTWRATVTVAVTTPSGASVAGATVTGGWSVGAPDSCTTDSSGRCSVTSDSVSRSSTRSITFTVTDATHATYLYDAAANVETSITIKRP